MAEMYEEETVSRPEEPASKFTFEKSGVFDRGSM